MPITFERLISLADSKEKLKEMLQDIGLSEEAAHKAAFDMSEGDISQVQKDLHRAPVLRLNHEATGVKSESFIITDDKQAQQFIDLITQENKKADYLKKYLHQGGFMNAAELLLTYYFRTTQSDEQMLMLETDKREFDITVHEDGSITFVESFDIPEIKTPTGDHYKPSNGPVASVSLSSTLKLNDKGEIEHNFDSIHVIAKDKAAKKLFNDPRSPFAKFVSWVQDKVKELFNPSIRLQNKAKDEAIDSLPKPKSRM